MNLSRLSRKLLRRVREALRHFRPPDEPPEDPYAYVTAPRIPNLPHLTASAKKRFDED